MPFCLAAALDATIITRIRAGKSRAAVRIESAPQVFMVPAREATCQSQSYTLRHRGQAHSPRRRWCGTDRALEAALPMLWFGPSFY